VAELALGTSPMPLIELTSAYAALAGALPDRADGVAGGGEKRTDGLARREPMLRLLETVIRTAPDRPRVCR
jgi:hypothetical protein